MIAVLFALALPASAGGPDPEELADAEMDANAQIEACRYSRCTADARRLAEATQLRPRLGSTFAF